MSDGIQFTNFNDFEKELMKFAKQNIAHKVEEKLKEIAMRLMRDIRKLTPVDTGILRDSLQVGKLEKHGDEWVIQVGFTQIAPYAKHVEFGHRTKGGGFVQGEHMVELSLKKLEKELPSEMLAWLKSEVQK